MENDKTEQNTPARLIVDNIDVGNTILACFYMKDAADLLESEEPQLSDILLKLVKATLDKIQFSMEDFNTLKQRTIDFKAADSETEDPDAGQTRNAE